MAGIHKLSDVKIKSRLAPGRYGDGNGLYLEVAPTGTKSWLFLWKQQGKRRAIGLGGYPTVPLAKARVAAANAKSAIADGRNPVELSNRKQAIPSFAESVAQFLEANRAAWRNEKHKAQWEMTLGDAYCRQIGEKTVDAVTTEDVLNILTPIWTVKAETASRIRGRIERVLDFAKVKGWREGINPAQWNGHLRHLLPARQKLQRGHHPAMPYKELPTFMPHLRKAEAMSARALEFLILTASRSGEVYGAQWKEFDLEGSMWTVPAERMKSGRRHQVPLSRQALTLVRSLHEVRVSEFVFPGQRPNKPLSSSAMEMLMRRLKVNLYTVHGFRSAFRDWAGDETAFTRETAEAALAHQVGDATERAYRRGDAIAKRQELMQVWADYCLSVFNDKRGA